MTFTFIPTQSGYMRLEDSHKLLLTIFPNYPSLEPCHSAPRLEPRPEGSEIYLSETGCLHASHVPHIIFRKAEQV